MAKPKRRPHDPARAQRQREDAAKRREAARRSEDAAMRADGVDPKIARWGDDPLDTSRVEALERQGFEVVHVDSRAANDRGVSTIAHDHRGRQVRASHKADIWQQLLTRKVLNPEQVDAVRALQDLMAIRAGVGGRDEKKAYADQKPDEPFRDPCLVSDAMLEAGREMDLTLSLVGPPSSRLLTALLWPGVLGERGEDWRAVVARVTGVTYALSQTVPLQMAAQGLVDVRPEVRRQMKQRKAQRRQADQSARERADPQALSEGRTHPFHDGPGA